MFCIAGTRAFTVMVTEEDFYLFSYDDHYCSKVFITY